MVRPIGLHLRLQQDLITLIHKAIEFKISLFQCFLTSPMTGTLIRPTAQETDEIKRLLAEHSIDAYVHISYHANICDPQGFYFFSREVGFARSLGFKYVVVHPGSAKWCGDREKGIAVCIENLNATIAEHPDITIILENSAHAQLSIGGDMHDFGTILQGIKQPERIRFCIDTAHAYVTGYDLIDEGAQDQFVALLDTIIGSANIALIHLNDTQKKLGSYVDQHYLVGQGLLGQKTLQRFILQPALATIPIILELPLIPDDQERAILQEVYTWDIADRQKETK